MAKDGKAVELRETKEIIRAGIRYYESVLSDFDRRMADIDAKQKKLDDERDKLRADYESAPTKIASWKKDLEMMEKSRQKELLDPRLKQLEKLRAKIEELAGQGVTTEAAWAQIEALIKGNSNESVLPPESDCVESSNS